MQLPSQQFFQKQIIQMNRTILRVVCISEFCTILQESCDRSHLDSFLLSYVNNYPFTIGQYSLFASLCVLVFKSSQRLNYTLLHVLCLMAFFSPCNCISSIFLVLFQFKLFSQVPGDFRVLNRLATYFSSKSLALLSCYSILTPCYGQLRVASGKGLKQAAVQQKNGQSHSEEKKL